MKFIIVSRRKLQVESSGKTGKPTRENDSLSILNASRENWGKKTDLMRFWDGENLEGNEEEKEMKEKNVPHREKCL